MNPTGTNTSLQFLQLSASHVELQKELLIRTNAVSGLPYSSQAPFLDDSVNRYFLYLTNRQNHRYSQLYDFLDEGTVQRDCKMGMGYSNLWLCKGLMLHKGTQPIAFSRYSSQPGGENMANQRYLVFQSPFSKLYGHDYHDVLARFASVEQANDFAREFTQREQITTLVAELIADLYWH